MFLSVPASSAGAYWWCVYLPLEHFALWVKPTFHIFTENFRLVGSPYFWSQKKIYQNFRISFEYVPIFRKNPSKSLKTERELDLVQSQVFLEVEKILLPLLTNS